MKIKTKYLIEYIKKASLDLNIISIKMSFREDNIFSSTFDCTKSAVAEVKLSKDVFDDYEPIGDLYIKNTKQFYEYLKSFSEEITIKKIDDYMINISDVNRKADIILGSNLIVEGTEAEGKMPKVVPDSNININKKDILASIRDMTVLETNQISFIKEKEQLLINVGIKGESDFFSTVIPTTEEGESIVNLGPLVKNLINCIDKTMNMSMKINNPILVKENNEYLEFTCMIAPLT